MQLAKKVLFLGLYDVQIKAILSYIQLYWVIFHVLKQCSEQFISILIFFYTILIVKYKELAARTHHFTNLEGFYFFKIGVLYTRQTSLKKNYNTEISGIDRYVLLRFWRRHYSVITKHFEQEKSFYVKLVFFLFFSRGNKTEETMQRRKMRNGD